MGWATTKRSNTGADNDKATVGLADLVIDRYRPKTTPMIKITWESLFATMKAGQFPQPIPCERRCKGLRWRVRDVLEWLRRRALLNPATASQYDLPAPTPGSSLQAQPARKARSPRLDAPIKSGECVTVFSSSSASTHSAESAQGELVPVTPETTDTAGRRWTESEAFDTTTTTPPGGTTHATHSDSTRVATGPIAVVHALRPAGPIAEFASVQSASKIIIDNQPYSRTRPRPHKQARLTHLNGPQEAYEALALPTYPFVLGGLVGLPGSVA